MEMKWQKPAITVKISGSGPYMFLLDSGAGPALIVDQDLAQELKLPKQGTDQVGDPSNPHALAVDKVMVDTVQVGDLVYEGVESLEQDRPLYSGPDQRGVVGLGLLGGMLVTFDYPAGRVRFLRGDLPEPDGKEVFACRMVHNIPAIDIDVAGKKFEAHLDTGSTGFISSLWTWPRSSSGRRAGRDRPGQHREPPVSGLRGHAQGDGAGCQPEGGEPHAALHGRVPCQRRERLPAQRRGHHRSQEPAAPLRLRRETDRPRSHGLASACSPWGCRRAGYRCRGSLGSLAEKAGIKAGDVVVKINGQPVAPMKPGDVAMAMRATPLRLTLLRDGGEVDVAIPAVASP